MPWTHQNRWDPYPPEHHVLISGTKREMAVAWISAISPKYQIDLIEPTLEDAYRLAAAEIQSWGFLFCTDDEYKTVLDSGIASFLDSRLRRPLR